MGTILAVELIAAVLLITAVMQQAYFTTKGCGMLLHISASQPSLRRYTYTLYIPEDLILSM